MKPTNLQTYLVTQPFIEFYSLLVVIKGNYWFYDKLLYLLTHSVIHQPAQWLTYPFIQVLALSLFYSYADKDSHLNHIFTHILMYALIH